MEDKTQAGHELLPPEIEHSDRRPVGEIWPSRFCGCGRKVRYISCTDRSGNSDACNKYGRCKSWDELHEEVNRLRSINAELLDVCREALKDFEVINTSGMWGGHPFNITPHRLRAAIAKAEGE